MLRSVFLWMLSGLMSLAVAATSPYELMQSASEKALAALAEVAPQLESEPQLGYQLIEEHVLPLVDTQVMAKLTLAKHWKRASPAQREQFTAVYRDMLVRTYSKSLSEFVGKQLVFLPPKPEPKPGRATVFSEVIMGDGRSPIPVNYKLRQIKESGEWKAYDIVIEGLSLVKNYRTSFGAEITKNGLDALIARLSATNELIAAQKP